VALRQIGFTFAVAATFTAVPAFAQDHSAGDVEELRAKVERQAELLERYRERLDALEATLQRPADRPALDGLRGRGAEGGVNPPRTASAADEAAPRADQVAQQSGQTGTNGQTTEPVGQERRPPEDEPLEVSGVREAGGILTPQGRLVWEPSIQYEQSSSNRFFFSGVEIVDTVLVGDLEVSEADRDTLTQANSFRFGLTDRLELSARVPFVYRSDQISTQTTSDAQAGVTSQELDAAALGDVEVSGRYQLNSGTQGWPIFTTGLRFKTDTGVGPYELDRDDSGNPEELSTGSGFYAVEPSLAVVYPTDPAVLYGNVSYLWNIARDVDTTIGGSEIGEVDPGDSVGIGFGMGFSVNEDLSFNLGYSHNFIFETTQEIDGVTVEGESFDVGALNFGVSLAVAQNYRVSAGVQVGVTEDAPDVVLSVRVPIGFQLYE
jgi:hypothetical protein